LIYAAIAVAWLAYLIPNYLRRREEAPQVDDEADVNDRFSHSVRMIRSGPAVEGDEVSTATGNPEISTQLTRRESLAELRGLEQHAAARRRGAFVGLLMALTGVVAVATGGLVPWWSAAIPASTVAGFFAIARHSVARMRRDLDERYATLSSAGGQSTMMEAEAEPAQAVDSSASVTSEQSQKPAKSAALWDPLPITTPTYVSKPLAPRTVRTIDLSAPELTPPHRADFPVTAEPRPAAELVPEPDTVVQVANPDAAKPGTSASDAAEQRVS
jgi:hypothetical protein